MYVNKVILILCLVCFLFQNTTEYLGNYSGTVFDYQYSSRVGDGAWLGLHKVENYAQYICVSHQTLYFCG